MRRSHLLKPGASRMPARDTTVWFAVVLLSICGSAAGQSQGTPLAASASGSAMSEVIAGRVLSAADGHPLANARVTLTLQGRNGRRRVGVGGRMQEGMTQPGIVPALQPRMRQGQISEGRTSQAQPTQAQTTEPQTAQTDADGRYRLTASAAGRYTLQASAPGYLASAYLQHGNFSTAIVIGAGLSTDNLNFSLLPEASLHGRILDDTGEPVRASVMLYREADGEGTATGIVGELSAEPRMAGGMQSDEDGQYQFSNLQPGRYYVAVTATPWYAVHARVQGNEDRLPYRTSIDPALDVAYPVTFYPHATTEATATPIVLKPGSRANANIVLQAEPAITLTVQMPAGDGGQQPGRPLFPGLFSKIFGSDQGVPAAIVGRQGDTVQITGLAAGQYALRAMGRPGLANAETPVNLSAGAAMVSLPAINTGATDLDIHLHTAGGSLLDSTVSVSLRRSGFGAPTDAQVPGKLDGGVAHFVDVQPGQYRVVAEQDGEMWTVSRLVVAGKAVASRLLRVDGSPIQVEVTLSRYLPEVDGIVKARDGKLSPGSLAVLVPAGAETGEDLFRADQSDLDGGFHFLNVMPGNYLLIALNGDWKGNWRSSAALMPFLPQAVPVTVPVTGPPIFRLQEAVTAQQNR